MLNFLYITDIHGDIQKYEDVLKYAIEHKIKLIHLGADLLPKGRGLLYKQKKFVKNYLKNFYAECERNDIGVLAFFGNDDAYTRKKYFREYADLLDEVPYKKNGYLFKAYGFVSDHCFGFKNGCKLDNDNSLPEKIRPVLIPMPLLDKNEFIDYPVIPDAKDVNESGLYVINDIEKYFKTKGTIEADLKKIKAGFKTIMAIHNPPCSVNLDVCYDFARVGSRSVLHWIEKNQPLLVLSGHIHENYEMTKTWQTYIGKTMVIQPGQSKDKTIMVYIEIKKDKIDAQLIII